MDLLLNALNDASHVTHPDWLQKYNIITVFYSIGSHHDLVATELSRDIMERRGWGLKITSKVLVHISVCGYLEEWKCVILPNILPKCWGQFKVGNLAFPTRNCQHLKWIFIVMEYLAFLHPNIYSPDRNPLAFGWFVDTCRAMKMPQSTLPEFSSTNMIQGLAQSQAKGV